MINKFYFENFKSYKYAELNMGQFVTLIGANASGKSNAVEGIQILSELAKGIDIGNILDGVQGKNDGIRGGAQGSKRFRTNAFKLGCRLCAYSGQEYLYEIKVGVNGTIHIEEEALYLEEKNKPDEKKMLFLKLFLLQIMIQRFKYDIAVLITVLLNFHV